jgi:hypothetical protein
VRLALLVKATLVEMEQTFRHMEVAVVVAALVR